MKVSNTFSPLLTRSQRQKLTKKVFSKVSTNKNNDEEPGDAPKTVATKKKPGRKSTKPASVATKNKAGR